MVNAWLDFLQAPTQSLPDDGVVDVGDAFHWAADWGGASSPTDPSWTLGIDKNHDGMIDVNQDGVQDTQAQPITDYSNDPAFETCRRVWRSWITSSSTTTVSSSDRGTRACTHKSPRHVRFRANRTLSRHRRMTESDRSC
jgi:hypothetical protein